MRPDSFQDSITLDGKYLTDDEIADFQTLVKETMGKEITRDEAEDQGTRLIMLMEAFQRFEPIPLSYKDIIDGKTERSKYGRA
jgi:benzoyl-CoA reductase/2-hydroxyglutaryl-CoA dehydratase subunit BcrC/BadD/HgdB